VKELKINTPFSIYDSQSDLPSEINELMLLAQDAITRAYAPYSHFQVGAAVLLVNGKVVTGNNQENAAYPSGMCAERVAIWSAASQYPGIAVKKVVISVKSTLKQVNKPVAPCGACRQTLLEYEHNQKEPIEVFFMGETGKVVQAHSLKDLLPFAFDESFL
jgi:cytidine deaminase